ncbi:MAG TPA: hypothetical protein VE860_00995 [Chthoniobacterales bacterium]|jgi:hypothetical protein|nr:hypothetical protein [Chthoniobacterales bacterium]
MELASDLVLSEEIKDTMGVLPHKESKVDVSKYFGGVEKPPREFSSKFRGYLEQQRGSLFNGYYEKHQGSELFSCRSRDGVTVVFCPSDHTGVWAGLIVQGSVGKRTQQMLEGIAKDKGLI